MFNSVIEIRFQTRQGSLYPFICMQSFLLILGRNYDFSIIGSMIVFTYALYYKKLQFCRVHVIMLFLEYPKNTQVIMYTSLTCQWYQLHLTRFCILLPCLFITYQNSICFIGFHVLHVNKNLT